MAEEFDLGQVLFYSGIIAAIVSGIISIILLLIREKLFEPNKFKKSAKFSILEERLQVYGKLNSLLEAAKQRAKNAGGKDYVFTKPIGTNEFRETLENNHHLFSEKLSKEYFNIVEKDTFHGLSTNKKENDRIGFFTMPLDEMYKIAKEEYSQLQKEFQEITGYEYD